MTNTKDEIKEHLKLLQKAADELGRVLEESNIDISTLSDDDRSMMLADVPFAIATIEIAPIVKMTPKKQLEHLVLYINNMLQVIRMVKTIKPDEVIKGLDKPKLIL